MAHSKAVWTLRWSWACLLAGGLLAGFSGCTDIEPCDEQGQTQSCTCSEGAPGSQVCLPEKVWDDCVCGDEPDGGPAGGSGGMGGGGSGSGGAGGSSGAGGGPVGGAGGSSGSGGAGGSAAGTGAAGDAGMDEPIGDGGLAGAGAGGAGGSSGAGGGAGGSSGSGGAGPDPYRDCTEDSECGDGNTCLSLTDFVTEFHVCAPACTVSTLCPVPAGSYEASTACVSDDCRLDCTPNPDPLFGEPLSCPTGMSCKTADALTGTSYCYR